MTSQEFIEALTEIGYDPTHYSGRYMYGESCVAISVDDLGESFDIGYELARIDAENPGAPHTDNMGLGYVLYWPRYKWPAS